MKSPKTPLLYAASTDDADQLYYGGCAVPDPYFAFGNAEKRGAVVSKLEVARVRKESRYDDVFERDAVLAALRKEREKGKGKGKNTRKETLSDDALILRWIAREYKIKRFCVAPTTPMGLLADLEAAGVKWKVGDDPFFPARVCKSDDEAAQIREANAICAHGFKAAEKLLKAARIEKNKLMLAGKPLTSERVREAIDIACLEKGAIAANTIVAGGDQACDPHCRGSGPLRPHELIIIDIFPRVQANGYHGDMTRTYLRGEPTDEQKRLVATVKAAQAQALSLLKAGQPNTEVYTAVNDFFVQSGFETTTKKGVPVGFFHGLGHGLGLDVHEFPRLGARKGPRLQAGMVVTVEPGLYYPGVGGCRFEDVVRLTDEGVEMLSSHPYKWHLK